MIYGELQQGLPLAVPLGVGTQTLTAMVGGLFFAYRSGCRAVIAGPDINPTVFIAEGATAVISALCPHGPQECDKASSLLPTILMSSAISALLVASTFILLGGFRLTEIIGYFPANVVSGFLSCIGYKVLKKSIEVAAPASLDKPLKLKYIQYFFGSWDKSWRFITPALPIGLVLYVLKRNHIGKPTIYFPLLTLGPTAIFYICVYASGLSLEEAREIGWLFPRSERNNFWSQFEQLYGGLAEGRVEWSALGAAIPSWLVSLTIVNLDNMLKLASTEVSLSVDFDYNREMKVGGMATCLAGLLCGSPAYSQTKFNVLNYGMTHSINQRVASLVCAGMLGVLYFSGLPLINYLPRFMLSGLLVFSAAGFLVENLIDTRKKFNRLNFASCWAIFLVNIIAGEIVPSFGLLIAIATGVVLGLAGFAAHYARKSGGGLGSSPIISGEAHCSTAIRSAAQEAKLGVLGVWYHIVHAQGYIFFGTASRLHRLMKAHIQTNTLRPRCERTKMLIFDLTDVYGIDATAGSIFLKSHRLAKQCDITIVWAGLTPSVTEALRRSGVYDASTATFPTLDSAEKWVEDRLLAHVHNLALKWLLDKTCRDVYNRAMLHDALTTGVQTNDGGISPSQLLKWSARTFVPKDAPILREGEDDDGLYLLYRGLVQVAEGVANKAHTIYPGAYFNEHVLYSPPETGALFTAIAEEDCVLLRLSHDQRQRMQYLDPHHAYQLLLSVFKQVEMRQPARRHHTWLEAAGMKTSERMLHGPDPNPELKGRSSPPGASSPRSPKGSPRKSPSTSPAAESVEGKERRRRSSFVGGVESFLKESLTAIPTLSVTRATSTSQDSVPSPMRRRNSWSNPGEASEAGAAQDVVSGTLRRKTSKNMSNAERITHRDRSMRALLTRAKSSNQMVASCPSASVSSIASLSRSSSRAALDPDGTMLAQEFHASTPSVPKEPSSGRSEGRSRRLGSRQSSRSDMGTEAAIAIERMRTSRSLADADLEAMLSPDAPASAQAFKTPSRAPSRLNLAEVEVELKTAEDFESSALSQVALKNEAFQALSVEERNLVAHPLEHAAHDHYHRHTEIVDEHFLHENDYTVQLTETQREHYSLIFELNDHLGQGHLKVAELANFMDSLGHGVEVGELERMISEMGIDEDADGTILKEDFLEFMRRNLVADLPSSRMSVIHALIENEASRYEPTPAEARHSSSGRHSHLEALSISPPPDDFALPATVGGEGANPALSPLQEVSPRCEASSPRTPAATAPSSSCPAADHAVGAAVGAAGGAAPPAAAETASPRRSRASSAASGSPTYAATPGRRLSSSGRPLVSRARAAKMLLKLGFLLDEVSVDEAFDEVDGDGDGQISEAEFITCLGMLKRNLLEVLHLEESFKRFRGASTRTGGADEQHDDQHVIYASDLVAALGVSDVEAEEMIFIADLKDNQQIDFTEFKQVVVNWSG